MNIFFDKELKAEFLGSLGIKNDSEGFLFYTKTKERLSGEDKKPIKAQDFVGFRQGSLIPLSNDLDTIIREASLDQES